MVTMAVIASETQSLRKQHRRLSDRVSQAAAVQGTARREMQSVAKDPNHTIVSQLSQWNLSDAESDVALLMLKGFSHKEIARLRGSSSATVRQQASSIYEKSRHGRSKLPGRDHPGVSGPCPHPHTAAQQPRGCGFVISFILRTILRARAELAPSPTPRLRRVVTRLHRGPRRWFLAVRSCRSPRRFDRAISRFI